VAPSTLAAPAPAAPPDSGRLPRSSRPKRLPSPRLWGWLAPLAVALFALGMRLHRLSAPGGVYFDEVYYAADALDLLEQGVEVDDDGGRAFVVHPPLGKWLIAIGLALAGTTRAQVTALGDGGATGGEVGYRLAAAVAGALIVLVLCRVARRMTGSTLLGCLAGLLVALDGLHFVHSRIAMLDIFLTLWILAAFACLVADRDVGRARLAAREPTAAIGLRWWRVGAGVCLGAAVATKWTAAYAVVVLVLLCVAWDVGARRSAGEPALRTWARRDLRGTVAALAALPPLVYLASWSGWLFSGSGWDRDWAAGRHDGLPLIGGAVEALQGLAHYHLAILDFHSGLAESHPYASVPAQWLPMTHPVVYSYAEVGQGVDGCRADLCAVEVLGVGTPVLWWAASLALLGVLWLWLSRRDWRAATVLALSGALLLPWFAFPDRTMFLFYVLPALPFLVLGLVLLAGVALGPPGASPRRRTWAALGVGLFVVLVAANFAYLLPVLDATPLPRTEWWTRMWFEGWVG
jgi:dolichyl-phosphate-mannose-protein mannosyltransferase